MNSVLTPTDRANSRVMYAKDVGNFSMGKANFEKIFDLAYFGVRKFGFPASFTKSIPSFLFSVSHIIALCAKEKVGRITALGIIAMMANHHIGWNRAKAQFICFTMRTHHILTYSEVSISLFRGIGVPFPTIRWIRGAIDFIPKAFHLIAFNRIAQEE